MSPTKNGRTSPPKNTRPAESMGLVPQAKRPKKRSYFFQPIDSITGNPNGSSRTATTKPSSSTSLTSSTFSTSSSSSSANEHTVKRIDQNVLNKTTTTVSPIAEAKPYPTSFPGSPKRVRRNRDIKVVTDHSDDSYDGILWKESPELKNKVANPSREAESRHPSDKTGYSSSPLKVASSQRDNNQTVPKTPEILSRYGTNFHNTMSRSSPRLSKTCSDLSGKESTSKKSAHLPPPAALIRSKSNFLSRTDPCEKSSSLSEWINKLEDTHSPKSTTTTAAAAAAATTTINRQPLPSSPSKEQVQTLESSPSKDTNVKSVQQEHSSDPFSDDEEVLAIFNHSQKQGESIQTRTRQEIITVSSPPPRIASPPKPRAVDSNVINNVKNDDNNVNNSAEKNAEDLSDDPFSDDDIEELMQVSASASASASAFASTSSIANKSTEFSKFTKLFKEGMRHFEEASTSKENYQEKEERFGDICYGRPELRRLRIKEQISPKPTVSGLELTPSLVSPSSSSQLSVHNSYKTSENIFLVESPDGVVSTLKLKGQYCELEIQPGDIVHVIVTDDSHPNIVDDTTNLLIWNPDILLSATTIASQINCPRKSILLSRFKFPGTTTVPIIVGEIVHFVFQECMATETWTLEFMSEVLEQLMQQYLVSIFSIGEEENKVKSEVQKHFSYLKTWFDKYYKKPIGRSSRIENTSERNDIGFACEEILDIEEDIKSPAFGIKGKIDATMVAKLQNNQIDGKFLLPMEIKTGREYVSHSAQATLYALLFKDRYNLDIKSSVLVYTKEQLTKRSNINAPDLRALINLRNKVSQHHKNNETYPPLLKRAECARCEVQSACMVIDSLMEDGNSKDCGIDEETYLSYTSHISSPDYKAFLKTWDGLIAKEEAFMSKTIKHLWTIPTEQRSAQGGCLDNLKVVKSTDDEEEEEEEEDKESSLFHYATVRGDKSTARRFTYVFERASDAKLLVDFQSTKFNVNDRVIISDQSGQFAITNGLVKSVSPSRIVISTRRRIITCDQKLSNFSESNNQVYKSLIRGHNSGSKINEKLFIIDKDEMFYGLGLARYNILSLFLDTTPSSLRELVVNLRAPTFTQSNSTSNKLVNFNPSQIAAFNKVFAANDYALILGMPGTGKSTLIVEIIKEIVERGETVLLTSYTNSAVDNILLKLLESNIGKKSPVKFIRIGHPSRVQNSLHQYIPDYANPIQDQSQFIESYCSPNLVAATCLGVRDLCFNIRTEFDYCIVDEASQITFPISIGPIQLAKKFILVGDHYQLPPLVLHPAPEVRFGLSQSLFRLLAEAHPNSVTELTYQYRMCEEIMQLSNVLIYENKLKCGSDAVANQCLNIPNPQMISSFTKPGLPQSSQWMNYVFDSNIKVLFLDHDKLNAKEVVRGEAIKNHMEAKLIKQIVKSLVLAGVEEKQIGVMSFYRAQLNLLKKDLSSRLDLEILTADQYQGRDKECIIISLVRSNDENNAGELLKEWRRLNVAVTRAKSKLIILGSRTTLSTTNTTKTFIDFLDQRNRYFQLTEGADTFYNFPESANSSPIKGSQLTKRHIKPTPILSNIIQNMRN